MVVVETTVDAVDDVVPAELLVGRVELVSSGDEGTGSAESANSGGGAVSVEETILPSQETATAASTTRQTATGPRGFRSTEPLCRTSPPFPEATVTSDQNWKPPIGPRLDRER